MVAVGAFPAIVLANTAHALDSYGWADIPLVEDIPGADHPSSVVGSYAIGIAGGVLTERLVSNLESRGSHTSAERVRRSGYAMTILGSLASQVAIETSMKGVGDKWDIVAGVVATMPGIFAGRGVAKIGRES